MPGAGMGQEVGGHCGSIGRPVECLDCVPTCAIKVEECKKMAVCGASDPRENFSCSSPSLCLPLGRCSLVSKCIFFMQYRCPLSHCLFSMAPQERQTCAQAPRRCPCLQQAATLWGAVPLIPPLLPIFIYWSFCYLLCRSCTVSPQFFRRKCSVCRSRFVSM